MDSLVGYLIALGIIVAIIVYIVLPIIGIVLGIALLVMGVVALYGSAKGAWVGFINFRNTLREAREKSIENIVTRAFPPPANRLSAFNKNPQPAYLMYIYDAAWFTINYTRQNVWKQTHIDAQAFL